MQDWHLKHLERSRKIFTQTAEQDGVSASLISDSAMLCIAQDASNVRFCKDGTVLSIEIGKDVTVEIAE